MLNPWKGKKNSPVKKMFQRQQFVKNMMLADCWNIKETIRIDFIQKGTKMNRST